MAVAIDASTPAVKSSTATTTPETTAAFSPPAGSLLVALVGLGFGTSAANSITISSTIAGNPAWTVAAEAIGTTTGDFGIARIYYLYLSTAPGSITVSGAYTAIGAGTYLNVQVLTGANSLQPAGVSGSVTSSSTTSGEISVTTTAVGSMVFGLSDSPVTVVTFTPLSGTTQLGTTVSSTNNFTLASWRSTATTTTPGTSTLGGSWSAAQLSNTVAFEAIPLVIIPPINQAAFMPFFM